jgi:hypothetical protein
MDRETAKLVIDTFEDVISRTMVLLNELRGRCSPEDFAFLKREIARVMNGIDMNLYPIVLKQYPELDPLRDKHPDASPR